MKILGLTDLNSVGSGYASLSLPIFEYLAHDGHDVKVIGLANDGRQHPFPFSIFPCTNAKEAEAMIHNLYDIWTFDVLLVLMDIPFHRGILNRLHEKPFKYVGVFPVEAGPLSFSWAMVLMQMDKAFCISEFGTKECHSKGIMTTEHLPVGINHQAWRPAEPEERTSIRKSLGFDDDTFVVLTVADNQERKNLPLSFKAFAEFSKTHPDSKYVLVTREHLYAGWNIQELATQYGITDKLMIFERGLPFSELWMLYAASDAFLLLSKAEGYGLPILEAMAMKIPVVATDCTGIKDQLSEGRGWLVPVEYTHTDCFGNANRYWADPVVAAKHLAQICASGRSTSFGAVEQAYAYVQDLTWKKAADVLESYLKTVQEEKDEA